MAVLESALLTAADYQRLTPEWPPGPRHQLIEGELVQMSAPNRFHQEISGNLYFIIRTYLRKNPLGAVYDSPFDVYLDEHNVFQPDLLYVSRGRAATLVREGMRGAPDLVVEILSPSTAASDRRRKADIYARAGTSELWLIDPEQRVLEVFDLASDTGQPAKFYRCDADSQAILETSRFPGLRIVLAEIFTPQFD